MIDRDGLLRGDGKSSEKELSEDFKLKYKEEMKKPEEEKSLASGGLVIPRDITNNILEQGRRELEQRRQEIEDQRVFRERLDARREDFFRERQARSYDAIRHSQVLQDQTFPERDDFRLITPSGATVVIPGREMRLDVNSYANRAEIYFRLPLEVAHTIYREFSMESIRNNSYLNPGTSGAKGV